MLLNVQPCVCIRIVNEPPFSLDKSRHTKNTRVKAAVSTAELTTKDQARSIISQAYIKSLLIYLRLHINVSSILNTCFKEYQFSQKYCEQLLKPPGAPLFEYL